MMYFYLIARVERTSGTILLYRAHPENSVYAKKHFGPKSKEAAQTYSKLYQKRSLLLLSNSTAHADLQNTKIYCHTPSELGDMAPQS